MNGEENIMLIGLTENYSFDKEGVEYYKEQ